MLLSAGGVSPTALEIVLQIMDKLSLEKSYFFNYNIQIHESYRRRKAKPCTIY